MTTASRLELDDALRQRLDALSPAQRALVEQRLRDARDHAARAAGVERRGATDAPLSPAQELLWRLEQAAPGTSAYNVPRALRITGALDEARLQRALDALVARHEMLRTTVVMRDGEARQIVNGARAVRLDVVDLRREAVAQRELLLHTTLRTAASVPFDLERDPLLRATLIRLGDQEHALLLVTHHVASDGVSREILLRDLTALYADAPLPALAAQYADFAIWQREALTPERMAELHQYWRREIGSAAGAVALPADRLRSPAPDFAGARHAVELGAGVAASVTALARALGTTPFAVLLAALETLLFRYSGQDEFLVGTVLSSRVDPALDGVIGYFANALPIRATFTAETPFADVVRAVGRRALDASEHAAIPLDTIADELWRGRTDRPSTLFNVMFAMIDDAIALPRFGDATVEEIAFDRGVAKFDLTLAAAVKPDGVRLGLEYRTDLFDAATIERIGRHLAVLLHAAVSHPDRTIAALPVMDDAERRLVVDTWNATAVSYPPAATLASLVAESIARTPDAVAVIADGVALTYVELDERSRTLASFLAANGVRRNELVGVCMERSADMVVALVGILRAGAAYVPVDPEYPPDRVSYMLSDAGVRVLLTQAHIAPTLPAHDAKTVALDEAWESIAAAVVGAPIPDPALPDDLAYVIYTSGSTGRPKGAMNSHRGIVNRLLWMQDEYRLGASDVVLQKTPFSFDVSVWEFFWPLIVGARIVMAEPGGHRDPAYLAETITRRGVTVMHFVPSMLHAFLETPDVGACASTLRDVMCSGEALTFDLQERFFARLPGVRLHNLYGPTEAAVDVTYWRCIAGDVRRVVPIGRPVANTRMYVLDPRGEVVPVGVAGELYIGGVQVGKGYHNRPELTAERFVRDHFSADASARLYRTGDLARWLADGTLEYLGRTDHQIKLRGLRIELGEIEAAVCSNPHVRECVVVARTDARREPVLVAYYVGTTDSDDMSGELRRQLRQQLPEYMVPTVFVAMEALPLTPSGKVDRKLLPAPPEAVPAGVSYVAPRTPTERSVAAIWCEVLGRERVGVEDSFFDAGGNSLVAMRVVGRILAQHGVRLHFRLLFESPTVAATAAAIDRELDRPHAVDTDERHPAADGDLVPVTATQRMMWLREQMGGSAAVYHVRLAFSVHGAIDEGALRSALDILVARHDAFRIRFSEVDGELRQSIGEASPMPVALVDLRDAPDPFLAAEARLRADAITPFDLERPPLARATVARTGEDSALLLFVAHHLVFDGWSAGVFVRELADAYSAALAGVAPVFPRLAARFVDVAAIDAKRLEGGAGDAERAHWAAELVGAPPSIPLSMQSATDAAPGARTFVVIGDAAAREFAAFCHQRRASLFMGMLAAFEIVLRQRTGATDMVIATPVARRDAPETAHMIGCLANTLLIRGDVADDPDVTTLLERVRVRALRAYQHSALPLDDTLLAMRQSGTPVPRLQTMLVMQDDAPESLVFGPSRLTPLDLDPGTTSFELKLSVGRRGEALRVGAEYRADLLSASDVAGMLGDLVRVVTAMSANPQARISELLTGGAPMEAATAATAAAAAGAAHASETALERVIGGVWREVLRVDHVAHDASFFDVGGHSLMATQVAGRLGKILRVRVPVRQFFAHPTVESLAASLAADPTTGAQVQAIAAALVRLSSMSPEDRARLRAERDAQDGALERRT